MIPTLPTITRGWALLPQGPNSLARKRRKQGGQMTGIMTKPLLHVVVVMVWARKWQRTKCIYDVYMSLYLSLSVCLYVCSSACLIPSLLISLSLWQSGPMIPYILSVCGRLFYRSIYASFCVSISLSLCLSPSVCLFPSLFLIFSLSHFQIPRVVVWWWQWNIHLKYLKSVN